MKHVLWQRHEHMDLHTTPLLGGLRRGSVVGCKFTFPGLGGLGCPPSPKKLFAFDLKSATQARRVAILGHAG